MRSFLLAVCLTAWCSSAEAGGRLLQRLRGARSCETCQTCSGQFAPAASGTVGVVPVASGTAVTATNSARVGAGLAPLAEDPKLNELAAAHAANMAVSNRMYHHGGRSENVAYGLDGPGTVGMWLRSPGHRAAMLSTGVSRVGIGAAYSASGTPYWCAIYGN